MIKHKIGENAGLIWQTLNDNSEMPIIELKELTKLKSENFFMAIGWLTREEKIFLYEKDKSLWACLIF